MRNLRKRDGFTLIELMIVVVIIGILAAIAIPRFNNVSRNAKQAEAEPILKQICTLASAHQMRNGTNATNIAGLAPSGWADPTARYYQTWAYTPGAAPVIGTATAALTAAGTGLQVPTIDCDTNTITWAAAAP
jgi:prepilin-type N-terminal cleavage/methylation domain-containing protein